jgi:hypothetical protein
MVVGRIAAILGHQIGFEPIVAYPENYLSVNCVARQSQLYPPCQRHERPKRSRWQHIVWYPECIGKPADPAHSLLTRLPLAARSVLARPSLAFQLPASCFQLPAIDPLPQSR